MASREATSVSSYAFLEQALWKRFSASQDSEQFIKAWLALQCRFIDDSAKGVVVLGEPDIGPFGPVAFWPDDEKPHPQMMAAAEQAMQERKGVVFGGDDEQAATSSIAYPLYFQDRLHGVVAVTLQGREHAERDVLRQLRWGSGWLELQLNRNQIDENAAYLERTSTAFDILATALESPRFQDACNAIVTELALKLDCNPVSIGFLEGRRIEVKAISHAAQFGEKMNMTRAVGKAMEEAVDQNAVVLYPVKEDWEYRVTRLHEELVGLHRVGAALTIPLHAKGRVFGAITFEGDGFDESSVELCDAIASVIGPVLEEKKLNDRWIGKKLLESLTVQLKRLLGPHYFGRKLAALFLLLLTLYFSFATTDYRVTAPAMLEGKIQRIIVAPFDAFIKSQHARAGETVEQGELIAKLDDRDLSLERLRWITNRRQHLTEYDKAMAEHNRTEANIRKAQLDEADAQIALLDEQLARTRITAPFSGIIVKGDLTQSIGAAVARGQELFELAPLDAYRVTMEVDERDISGISPGQEGVLRITSIPETPLAYTVERIIPVSEQAEGRNYFRVEGRLHVADEQLRPGMEGVAKTLVGERLLIVAWTEKIIDWFRLMLWKWIP